MSYLLINVLLCATVLHAKPPDWLTHKITTPTTLSKTNRGTIVLSNGLMAREFLLSPNFATVDLYSFEKDVSLFRALSPEAVIALDELPYNVGGLLSTTQRAYCNRSEILNNASSDPNAFQYVSHSVSKPVAPFPYRPLRGAPADIVWPPKGLRLDVVFQAPFSAPAYHQDVTIEVHYEMYDGMPVMAKWISATVEARSYGMVSMAVYSVEYLAVNQLWSPLWSDVMRKNVEFNWFHVETDQAHGTLVRWDVDPAQKTMPGSYEPIVNCSYTDSFYVPLLQDGYESFKVHELIIGSSDPERSSLAHHRMMRTLAPHVQENPIFFHNTNGTSEGVRMVIDQMAEVGFEMMIYSFGSGFDVESDNDTYIQQVAADIAYAKSKGIEVGGYDLISLSRKVPYEWMALAKDSNATVGSACFASGWYDFLLDHVLKFINKTGLSMLETDGPYGGYACSSTTHSHHTGYEDSVYYQQKLQGRFFGLMRQYEVFVNQPDNFFYQGGSKTGLGYSEWQFSLPRWQDLTISRQNLFDDTYRLPVTVGWMFVPLMQYHGGGSEAMFEPLETHLLEYEWALAQYMGAGVSACYRGARLYDTDKTKAVVKKWVTFYKKYRDILISDLVHVRRTDMQGIDSFMHVNSFIKNKGLAMVFNPTDHHITTSLTLPLYYTGLTKVAMISHEGGPAKTYQIDQGYNVDVPIDLQALSITWYLIQ